MTMKYATESRLGRREAKLLYIDTQNNRFVHYQMRDLANLVPDNALMVVNQAATLPARFEGYIGSIPVELRLVRNLDSTLQSISKWQALIFYGGSWRQPTEDRDNPEFLEIGQIIQIQDLQVEISNILHPSKRLVEIQFIGTETEIWNGIYNFGKPIQYSHLCEELNLWDVQTIFSSIPVAMEPASASFQFTWEIVNELVKKGVEIVGLTHATSISSTGLTDIDRHIPFEEYYYLSGETAVSVQNALDANRPIIAIGTSVTRALEDNFLKFGKITSGQYSSNLVIDQQHQRQVVSDLFTGMHLPEESHMKLLLNFVDRKLVSEAYDHAIELDYLWHEYGDVSLIHTTRGSQLVQS